MSLTSQIKKELVNRLADTRYSAQEKTMLPNHRIATHPGQILLQEFLQPMGLTQAELARSLAIPLNRVNELVRGKRGVTPETALLLAGYFKNSAEFWMNLQTAHDLTRVRNEMRHRPVAPVRGARRSVRAD
jgi:addiction module HigA family antidote